LNILAKQLLGEKNKTKQNQTKPNQTHGMVKDECNDTTIVKSSHTSFYYSYCCVHGKETTKLSSLDAWTLVGISIHIAQMNE
jgi:hypothetical protein